MTKKTIPVVGRIDKTGEARPFPAVKVIGGLGDELECPVCGAMLDKRDLVALIKHEQECGKG